MPSTSRTGTDRQRSTATGTGTLAALVLVAVCGSSGYTRWAERSADPNSASGWFLRLLAWPSWRLDPAAPVETLFTDGLRALLLVGFTAVLLYLLPGPQASPASGLLSQFFSGWGAYVFAAGFAAVLGTLFGGDPSLFAAVQAAGTAAAYGLFAGWIVGVASLGGRA
ncbi:hypothetical protein O7606_22110 [Micromonospora sp. WMMD882]|uniref:hypothetical protein n=1 Tax=Micromonospora sp. WMMD882 TaxID=3015151 RepID=UPI00248B4B22|nr:hypothetical protein [Micromonospora sp. WMMD882]WBB78868.1 hypothetical protein O7606_22110 [Micromonospora sp. WMMD882]